VVNSLRQKAFNYLPPFVRLRFCRVLPKVMDMKRISLIAFGVLLALPWASTFAQLRLVGVHGGNQEFALNKGQIAALEEQALDGSGDAAMKLAEYYFMVTLQYDEAKHWYQIGAENGNAEAMYGFWFMANAGNDPSERRRGYFWLKKAAALGDKQSQEALKTAKEAG
jgi:TPR repeat protein